MLRYALKNSPLIKQPRRLFSSTESKGASTKSSSGGSGLSKYRSNIALASAVAGTILLGMTVKRRFFDDVPLPVSPTIREDVKEIIPISENKTDDSMIQKDDNNDSNNNVEEKEVEKVTADVDTTVNTVEEEDLNKNDKEVFENNMPMEIKEEKINNNNIENNKIMGDNNKVATIPPPTLPVVPSEIAANGLRSKCSTAAIDEIVLQIADNHAEMEHQLLNGLESLDEDGLKMRIARLTAEALERSKWAPVRKQQTLRKLSADISEKYNNLLLQQRRELETEAARVSIGMKNALVDMTTKELHELRKQAESVTTQALNDQATSMNAAALRVREGFRSKMAAIVNEALVKEVSEIREKHTEEMLSLLEKAQYELNTLKATIKIAEPEGGVTAGFEAVSEHKRLATALKAQIALQGGEGSANSVKNSLNSLKSAYNGDVLVENTLASLPQAFTTGEVDVPTTEILRARLDTVRDEVMKTSLAPEAAPKIIGYAIGTVLYSIMANREGMVEGNKPEECFARARFYLDQGKLQRAVSELSTLDESTNKITKDWLNDAKARLAFDQMREVIRSKGLTEN